MKLERLNQLGSSVFDVMFLTLILVIGTFLVIPLIPLWIGIQKYIQADPEERTMSMVFRNIQENLSITLQVTLFLILLLGASSVNILFLHTGNTVMDAIIQGISYILLFLGITIMMHVGVIITNMRVTFREAIYNSLMLVFGGIPSYLLQLAILIGFVYLVTVSVIFYLGIFLVIAAVSRLSYVLFKKLKERIK